MIVITKVRNYWTEEQIKYFLNIPCVLEKALLALWDEQTDDEKNSGITKEHNGKGFNAYDAPFLSAMVKSLKQYGHLTKGQREKTTRILSKYSKQLTVLANDRKYNKEVFNNEEFPVKST